MGLGRDSSGLPGELTVTEVKREMRADDSPLSSRQNIICCGVVGASRRVVEVRR